MAITLTTALIQADLGYFLGYGRTSGSWSADQLADVTAAFNAGLRMFYWPDGQSVQWTFLQPAGTLSAIAGTSAYDLPADFASIVGDFTWPVTTGNNQVIPVIPEFRLRAMLQGVTQSNQRPSYAAIIPKAAGSGITWQAKFDNPFDASYTIGYTYRVVPTSDSTLYGIIAHGETILAACLAAAEQRIDSRSDTYRMDFQRRLTASISIDQQNKPNHTGTYYDTVDSPLPVGHQSTGLPSLYRNGVLIP